MFIGAQGHFFFLASARDALYIAAGQVLFVDPKGNEGTHVGNELDIYSVINVATYQSILIGYSHMFEGACWRPLRSPPRRTCFTPNTVSSGERPARVALYARRNDAPKPGTDAENVRILPPISGRLSAPAA